MTKGIAPPVLSLEGRTALITGGGTGLGKACATALAAAGASVTICGPDAAVLEGARADLAALDLYDVKAITADITDEVQVAAAVDAAAVDGALHIAVANAGVPFPGSLLHIGAEHWMGPIGVNVVGTAHTIKHAALAMMQGGGSIITISSIASTRPAAFMNTYSVSKAAVDELTRAAAAELGRFGIRVNGIRPGWMRTETVEATTDEKNLAMIRRETPLAADTPLGQLGDPDDVARAVVYLASDYSSWITGQLLGVCGGSSLPPPAGDFSNLARMLFPVEMARDFGPPEGQ
jgi:NAD(P)-dependent dehydrogenase (short-subunit alcohol dehydrogenase family)